MAVLTKFNSFSSVIEFYTQIDGLSMGSKLSPLISNLYCNLMEQKVVSKWIKKGIVVDYQRYVDDIFICIKKDNYKNLLSEMNTFKKKYLNFTVEKMTDDKLVFLDAQIYLDDKNIFQFRKYRKTSGSDFLIDFKSSVMPKKYKISILIGEIHRCSHTNTTLIELEIALQNLKKQFLNNNFPKRLMEAHIDEIKSRDFARSFYQKTCKCGLSYIRERKRGLNSRI